MNPYRAIMAIVIAASFSEATPIRAAEVAAVVAPSKWEYKDVIVSTKGSLSDSLNPFGDHGWEVVSVVYIPTEERFRILLKRTK